MGLFVFLLWSIRFECILVLYLVRRRTAFFLAIVYDRRRTIRRVDVQKWEPLTWWRMKHAYDASNDIFGRNNPSHNIIVTRQRTKDFAKLMISKKRLLGSCLEYSSFSNDKLGQIFELEKGRQRIVPCVRVSSPRAVIGYRLPSSPAAAEPTLTLGCRSRRWRRWCSHRQAPRVLGVLQL